MKQGIPVAILLVIALSLIPGTVAADEEVRRAQVRLEELGYPPGPIDGLWGPKTRAALARFQKASGLPVTERIDGPTRKALFQSSTTFFLGTQVPTKSAPRGQSSDRNNDDSRIAYQFKTPCFSLGVTKAELEKEHRLTFREGRRYRIGDETWIASYLWSGPRGEWDEVKLTTVAEELRCRVDDIECVRTFRAAPDWDQIEASLVRKYGSPNEKATYRTNRDNRGNRTEEQDAVKLEWRAKGLDWEGNDQEYVTARFYKESRVLTVRHYDMKLGNDNESIFSRKMERLKRSSRRSEEPQRDTVAAASPGKIAGIEIRRVNARGDDDRNGNHYAALVDIDGVPPPYHIEIDWGDGQTSRSDWSGSRSGGNPRLERWYQHIHRYNLTRQTRVAISVKAWGKGTPSAAPMTASRTAIIAP